MACPEIGVSNVPLFQEITFRCKWERTPLSAESKEMLDELEWLCIIGITLEKGVKRLGQRVGFYLTDLQIKELKRVSRKTGLTVSELIRRAVDDHLGKYREKKGR